MSAKTSGFRPEMTPEVFNARAQGYLGRTTQVWDAAVTFGGTNRKIAIFRCTQMVLWP